MGGAAGNVIPRGLVREFFQIMALAKGGVRLLHHASDLFNISFVDAVLTADGSIVFGMSGTDSGFNGLLRVGTLAAGGTGLTGFAETTIPQAAGGLPFTSVQRLDLSVGPDGRIAALYHLPEHGLGDGDLTPSIWVQRLDGGAILGDASPVSPGGAADRSTIYSSLHWLPDGSYGVLTQDETTPASILNPVTWQRFAANGTALAPAVTVVADGQAGGFVTMDRNPTMASAALLTNGRLAVAWTESSAFAAPTFGQPQVMMEIIRPDGGIAVAPVVLDGTSAQRPQVVALDGGGFAVGWLDYAPGHQGIHMAQIVSGNGRLIGDAFEISSTLSPQEVDLQLVALRTGGFAALWRDMSNQTHLARMFDARGNATGADFAVLDSAGDFIGGKIGAVAQDGTLTIHMHGLNGSVGSGFVLQAQDWSTQSSWGVRHTGTAVGEAITGAARDDRLSGLGGADTIKGGAGNDWLTGGAARDVLQGGDGNDHLEGNTGRDRLTGGNGADSFVFRSAADAGDRITDFDGAEGDRLVFFRDGFGGAAGVLSGATVNTAHQGLFFETTTGQLTFDADGAGAAARVLVVTLAGVTALAFDDLVFL